MIRITAPDFNTIREAIAGAHIYLQAFNPLIKQRRIPIDKAQRSLVDQVPPCVQNAFGIVAQITQREHMDPEGVAPIGTVTLSEIDTKTMRNELENISALVMPDVVYELQCAISELPGLAVIFESADDDRRRAARVAAIAWEAGRRYGIMQSIAIFENTSTDYAQATTQIFENALNSTLELPTPSGESKPAQVLPFASTIPRGATDNYDEDAGRTRTGNMPSCDACGEIHGENDCPTPVTN